MAHVRIPYFLASCFVTLGYLVHHLTLARFLQLDEFNPLPFISSLIYLPATATPTTSSRVQTLASTFFQNSEKQSKYSTRYIESANTIIYKYMKITKWERPFPVSSFQYTRTKESVLWDYRANVERRCHLKHSECQRWRHQEM